MNQKLTFLLNKNKISNYRLVCYNNKNKITLQQSKI